MCCFSGKVTRVANTRLFARAGDGNRQYLAYQMEFSADADLAMILPLPVPPGSTEKAVRFIDLQEYPDFFKELRSAFPEPRQATRGISGPVAAAAAPLPVVEVGSFEASFVPGLKDFARLDTRFRIADGVWAQLPQYKTYGFAVFKLKKTAHTVHPMAFEFPRADEARLFFPTVHIHDGQVHPQAYFDHALYSQVRGSLKPVSAWRESPHLARQFMNIENAKGLLDPDGHCFLRTLFGNQPNTDVFV